MLIFYLPAATKLKKHKADSAGTLVGLVAETLEGLNVINAYGERVPRRCPGAPAACRPTPRPTPPDGLPCCLRQLHHRKPASHAPVSVSLDVLLPA
jgi:hypothetical protein